MYLTPERRSWIELPNHKKQLVRQIHLPERGRQLSTAFTFLLNALSAHQLPQKFTFADSGRSFGLNFGEFAKFF